MKQQHVPCLAHGLRAAALAASLAGLAAVAAPVTNVAKSADPANPYQTYTYDAGAYVPLDSSTTVTVECPDPAAAEWIKAHFDEWFGVDGWFGRRSPAVKAGATGLKPAAGDEAYAASADETGVKISANTLAGARWAAYTIRQLAIAARGTFKTEGFIVQKFKISDRPHLAFRAIHLCWFPEVRPRQIERAIRLAAMLKFNYAIIEPWGMYESRRHPWWHWPNPTMTQKEVRRLVALGRDLGITLIPQINCYGHASSARASSIKHAMLDIHPEYAPLFEPNGWNWCLANPETQRVLRELIDEMHENFGRPPFFHLGCDEAEPQSCPLCLKTPGAELVCRHITGLADYVKSLGASPMIWHDMLLERGDPRWKNFVHCGSKETATLADTLPKDVIICDWQYSYGNMKEARKDWPTLKYFKDKGFRAAGCPWMNYNAMKPMADYIASNGGFGFIETTWHHLRGGDWEKMFLSASYAAWGSPVSHGVSFQRSLRLVGHDMKVDDYLDTGFINNQIPIRWW